MAIAGDVVDGLASSTSLPRLFCGKPGKDVDGRADPRDKPGDGHDTGGIFAGRVARRDAAVAASRGLLLAGRFCLLRLRV